ncbi:MAG TPA: serine/threonine-protein kinase, partial [Chthonomonadales bacterium]|nr:serine/threonine-protein kinase [Chthonomonadales bacterium]
QEPGLPLSETLDLGLQLCTVLDYLHTRQPPIIFRDLKPANIMRTPAGQVYLIDFGIARHFIPGKPKDTIPFGSPGYAPPEQYGKAQTTPQADIYSLGALLHQALSGDDPAESPFRFAPLRLYGTIVIADLNELIQRMVQVDASQRPASAAEVKELLQRLADEQAKSEPRVWRPPETSLPLPPHYTTYTGWHSGAAQQQVAQPVQPQHVLNRRRFVRTALGIGGTLVVGYAAVQVCQVASYVFRPHFAGIIADPNFTPVPALVPNYVFSHHTAAVTALSWSPYGDYIVSGSADRTAMVWRAADGMLVYTFVGYQSPLTSVTWSPDNTCVASSGNSDGSAQVWTATTGKTIMSFHEHQGEILALAWSPVSDSLIASGGKDKTIRIWDAGNGTHFNPYTGHTGSVRAVAWSRQGILASAGEDKTVRTWGYVNERKDYMYHGHTAAINALAWSPDGAYLASASDDGTVRVWDTVNNSLAYTYRRHTGPVNAVTWLSRFGGIQMRLASGGDDATVQVWNVAGEHIETYGGLTSRVRSLTSAKFGSDERIAFGSDDGTVHVWTPGQ